MGLALEALGVSGRGTDGAEPPLHLSFDIDSVDPKVRLRLNINMLRRSTHRKATGNR